MAYLRCSITVALVAIAIGVLPLVVSWWLGGWVRLYTHNPVDFTLDSIPDLTGRVAIVTGANTGIGKASARELARKGAHVILATRSSSRGLKAVEDITLEVGGKGKVQFMELDLASFQSIRAFAAQFLAKNLPLHILLLNAGVMMCPYLETAEGLEMQIGTNHFGHHLLVKLLEDKLVASAPSRVVAVSSNAHEFPYEPEGIRFDQFQSDVGYDLSLAYGQSKLANVLMANALARRLEGKRVFVNSCHPGVVDTELGRHLQEKLDEMQFGWVIKGLLEFLFRPGMFTSEQGAYTQLYLATHPDIVEKVITGQYFEPVASPKTPSAHALNVTLQEELWTFTENFIKASAPKEETPQPPVDPPAAKVPKARKADASKASEPSA